MGGDRGAGVAIREEMIVREIMLEELKELESLFSKLDRIVALRASEWMKFPKIDAALEERQRRIMRDLERFDEALEITQ